MQHEQSDHIQHENKWFMIQRQGCDLKAYSKEKETSLQNLHINPIYIFSHKEGGNMKMYISLYMALGEGTMV